MISFSRNSVLGSWQRRQWRMYDILALPAAEKFDLIIEGLLIALLTFCPLVFGVVHAWSEHVVVILTTIMMGVFLLKCIRLPETKIVWTLAYLPIVLFILLALFQLLPMPLVIIGDISPNTVKLKTELLENIPGSEESLSSMTLSFYPRATRHNIRMILAVATVFFVVVNIYRQPDRIKRLLAVIAIVGGAIAVLALAQAIAGNGKIYWTVPTFDKAFSGTFINHSHYGQFMNLSIGAALGFLLVKLYEVFGCRQVGPQEVFEYAGSDDAKQVKLLMAMIIIGAATVFISLTRGGMISMLVAAVFTVMILGSRKSLRSRSWILVLLALCVFSCVLWVGFDQVYDRLASLRNIDNASGGRWLMFKNTLDAWVEFPIFGTGLGTYETVYPMYESNSTSMSLASHTENEYIQVLMESGCLGLLILIIFGVIVWTAYAKTIRKGSNAIYMAAYGLGFGLLAILVHSLSDFGQHMPANAFLTAICCGLLISLSQFNSQNTQPHKSLLRKCLSRTGRLIAFSLLMVVFGCVVLTSQQAQIAEAYWKEVQVAKDFMEANDWQQNEQVSSYLFDYARAAIEAEPDNIYYRHWMGVYEWLSLKPYVDPNTDKLALQMLPRAREIAESLHRIRYLCPTFGATPCVAGEIEYFVLDDSEGAKHIQTGYRLAPCQPTACFAAARVDASRGNADEAFTKAHRAVELNGTYFTQVVSLCIDVLNRPDMAVKLAQDSVGRLLYVSKRLGMSPKSQDLAEQIQDEVFELLQYQATQPDVSAGVLSSLANLYNERGDLKAGIKHYRLAIQKDYDQVGWHYALASLLKENGQIDEAIHEAEICLRLRPDHGPAKKMIKELSVPSAKSENMTLSSS